MTEQTFGPNFALVEEFLDLPGYLGEKVMSPLTVGGVPLGRMQQALTSDDLAGQRQMQSSRFWSTPPRLQSTSPVRDIIEVDLANPKPVNHVTFDLAHFPQDAHLEFTTGTNAPWLPVTYPDGQPVVLTIGDSNPPLLSSTVRQSDRHPQHYGANHWVPYDLRVVCQSGGVPVEASGLRLVLTRPLVGNGPVNTVGEDQPYSLGVRSFTVGYKVESREDVPSTPLRSGSLTVHEPFAETRDILGSTVAYGLRDTPASNLTLGGIWRSEPQPVDYAVVTLYASLSRAATTLTDERTTLGDALVLDAVSLADVEAQVIDRVYLDPLVSGATVNIYYTNDSPDPSLADPWSYAAWTPINRDFKLRKGFYHFDPISAKHLKFEFTHLAAEPYEASGSVVRTVRMFPPSLSLPSSSTRSGNSGGSGTVVAQDLDPEFRFRDNARGPAAGITDTSRGYTPTEVFFAGDPAAAERLHALSPAAYNYLSWQGGLVSPSFIEIGPHNYVEVEVEHNTKVAFYVGLKALEVYRVNYNASEDTDQYLDSFHDGHNINDLGGWFLDGQDLHTPAEGAGPWTVTSKPLRSRSNVIGVQFATTQTPAVDLLAHYDSDFNSARNKTQAEADAGLQEYWEALGDALPHTVNGVEIVNPSASTRYNTDIGTTVKVTRQGTTETQPRNTKPHTYDSIGLRYGTYNNMRGLLWRDLDAGVSAYESSLWGGIRNRQSVTPAVGSRVYAAARVISPIALENPLILRLINTEGEVVAEKQAAIPANQIVEWFLDYTVGDSGMDIQNTYLDLETLLDLTYGEAEQFTWAQLETRRVPAPETLFVELIQKGVPNASWFPDTLSLFEDPIRWEFSNNGGDTWWPAYGIRNNPNGALTFPSDPEVKQVNTWNDLMGIFRGEDTLPEYPSYATLGDNGRILWEELEGRSFKDAPVTNVLMWRATSARPDVHINGLSIRPWYDTYERGLPSAEGVNVSGPNIAMYDHYQPIHMDPRYRMWNKPVPQSWYFFYRQFLLLRHESIQFTPEGYGVFLPETVIPSGGALPEPPPVAFSVLVAGGDYAYKFDTDLNLVATSPLLPGGSSPMTVFGIAQDDSGNVVTVGEDNGEVGYRLSPTLTNPQPWGTDAFGTEAGFQMSVVWDPVTQTFVTKGYVQNDADDGGDYLVWRLDPVTGDVAARYVVQSGVFGNLYMESSAIDPDARIYYFRYRPVGDSNSSSIYALNLDTGVVSTFVDLPLVSSEILGVRASDGAVAILQESTDVIEWRDRDTAAVLSTVQVVFPAEVAGYYTLRVSPTGEIFGTIYESENWASGVAKWAPDGSHVATWLVPAEQEAWYMGGLTVS